MGASSSNRLGWLINTSLAVRHSCRISCRDASGRGTQRRVRRSPARSGPQPRGRPETQRSNQIESRNAKTCLLREGDLLPRPNIPDIEQPVNDIVQLRVVLRSCRGKLFRFRALFGAWYPPSTGQPTPCTLPSRGGRSVAAHSRPHPPLSGRGTTDEVTKPKAESIARRAAEPASCLCWSFSHPERLLTCAWDCCRPKSTRKIEDLQDLLGGGVGVWMSTGGENVLGRSFRCDKRLWYMVSMEIILKRAFSYLNVMDRAGRDCYRDEGRAGDAGFAAAAAAGSKLAT